MRTSCPKARASPARRCPSASPSRARCLRAAHSRRYGSLVHAPCPKPRARRRQPILLRKSWSLNYDPGPELTDPAARIAEELHPRRILAEARRAPGQLHTAEAALGMRHDDGEAAIGGGGGGGAPPRAPSGVGEDPRPPRPPFYHKQAQQSRGPPEPGPG